MNAMIIFGAALVFVGIYLVSQTIKMKKINEVAGNIVLSEEDVLKCKDKKGFIEYIYVKEVLTGIAVIGIGIALVAKELVASVAIVSNGVIFIALMIILYFFYSLKVARNKYLY